ncbi:MAG: hypothetical protein L0J18_12975 [Tetragenococcus koreensis]|nr:hypothetical protein [Tetragenococcus koreensis]
MNNKTFYKVFVKDGEVSRRENEGLVPDGGKLMSLEFTFSELSRETLENGIKKNMFTDQDISLRLDDETNQGWFSIMEDGYGEPDEKGDFYVDYEFQIFALQPLAVNGLA